MEAYEVVVRVSVVSVEVRGSVSVCVEAYEVVVVVSVEAVVVVVAVSVIVSTTFV